ncbi:MAG: endolytic transglycosylase MltG [Candidatus Marinimicrobia bacterium]|nr:endolytic transglycosylase MltG [Candidatus Neomarinimicrobiota bacterium]MBL7023640.1 endolytic transglycosylase MltG [Candidatus Neomarinimicrobiota bacterium]MBL7109792.1 endolytic transglycosylase MltG [Candidatus Neomarinimicrobiota bacterium]
MKTIFQRYHQLIKIILSSVVVLLIGIVSFIVIVLSTDIHCKDTSKVITIPNGATAYSVSKLLETESCLVFPSIFVTAVKLTFNERNIKAGRYTLKGIRTIGELVRMITSPTAKRIRVTILEGWTIEDIADELSFKLNIDTYHFTQLCKDYNFMHSLGINAPSLEGFLFPDTYILLSSYTEEDIIELLVNQFNYNYKNQIEKLAKQIHLNKLEVSTLASIIQGEAIYDYEMSKISSVYHNRLKKNMPLQADPTIQYITPGKNRRLYHKDLKTNSPYNTYKHKGLPPGPINNSGISALLAAVNPDTTPYLYFVADGNGRHIFSKTNAEHNQAKYNVKKNRRK